jgi:hypothetical protein
MIFKKYVRPEFCQTYGVLDGDYKGHTLIYVEKHGDLYGFCDFFDGRIDARWIPKKDFDLAVTSGILELVDPQPTTLEKNEIKKITKAKFNTEKGKL